MLRDNLAKMASQVWKKYSLKTYRSRQLDENALL
jgi:hypothetical protein